MDAPVPGKDFKLDLPNGHLSASQINKFLRCPEQYRREYIEHAPRTTSSALWEGSLHHTVFEITNKRMIKSKKHLAVGDAIRIFTDLTTAREKEVDVWDVEKSVIIGRALEFYEQFFADDGLVHKFEPTLVEHKIETEYGGVPVIGYVDCVEPAIVTDLKVAKNKPDIANSIQLDIYADVLDQPNVQILLFQKKKKPEVSLLTHRRNLKKRRKWLEIVIPTIAQKISERSFHPISPEISWVCSPTFCPHWDQCYGKYH